MSAPIVSIRLASGVDAERVAAIYAPYVAGTAISFEIDPPGPEEMRERIEETLVDLPWLVCERGGEVVGYAYAAHYRTRPAYQWSASVSVYVDSSGHKSGVGRSLYTSLFQVLKLQGLHNLFAGITLPNDASVGLHKSLGFRQIALERSVGYKMGAWHDVSIWQLPLRESTSAPEPTVVLKRLIGSEELRVALTAGLPFVGDR